MKLVQVSENIWLNPTIILSVYIENTHTKIDVLQSKEVTKYNSNWKIKDVVKSINTLDKIESGEVFK